MAFWANTYLNPRCGNNSSILHLTSSKPPILFIWIFLWAWFTHILGGFLGTSDPWPPEKKQNGETKSSTHQETTMQRAKRTYSSGTSGVTKPTEPLAFKPEQSHERDIFGR